MTPALVVADRGDPPGHFLARVPRWPFVALALIVLATLFVVLTQMRPGFDAYGWLVWGHQALHLSLNTDGAPSWKPLTFLFTLPYALLGRAEMSLWLVTAVSWTLAGAVFAARIAYRLTGPCPTRRYAPIAAGAFAGVGVLGLDGYAHQVLIANSDPIVVALCLGSIDAHLSRHPRVAFALVVLASLGRPEAIVFACLYGVWAWRRISSMRVLVVCGLAIIPVLLFGIPAISSKSWDSAGNLALNSVNALHGDKFSGVIDRFLGLYGLPMKLAVLVAVIIAVARRDRVMLALAAAALIWVAVEIGFAYHGFSAVPRYMLEAGAVSVTLAGAAVGQVLDASARASGLSRLVGPVAVLVLVAALGPTARARARTWHGEISDSRRVAAQDNSLEAAITMDGGAARIRGCGQPVSQLGNQSLLAWDTGLNVGDVGYKPGRSIASGRPIMLFRAELHGWEVRPVDMPPSDAARCDRLRIDVPF